MKKTFELLKANKKIYLLGFVILLFSFFISFLNSGSTLGFFDVLYDNFTNFSFVLLFYLFISYICIYYFKFYKKNNFMLRNGNKEDYSYNFIKKMLNISYLFIFIYLICFIIISILFSNGFVFKIESLISILWIIIKFIIYMNLYITLFVYLLFKFNYYSILYFVINFIGYFVFENDLDSISSVLNIPKFFITNLCYNPYSNFYIELLCNVIYFTIMIILIYIVKRILYGGKNEI